MDAACFFHVLLRSSQPGNPNFLAAIRNCGSTDAFLGGPFVDIFSLPKKDVGFACLSPGRFG